MGNKAFTIFLQGMAPRVQGEMAILKGYQGSEIGLSLAAANTVRWLPHRICRARCIAFVESANLKPIRMSRRHDH